MKPEHDHKTFKFLLLGWLILPALLLATFLILIISSTSSLAAKTEKQSLSRTALEIPKEKLPGFTKFDTKGKGAATVLFNNAWKSQYSLGFNYLKGKHVPGSVSVITNYVGYPGYWNWAELREAQNNGWEILSQSKSYACEWDGLNSDQVREEVYGSKHDLLIHGIYVEHFAAPCGKVDIRLSDRVSYYYSSQKIGEEGINYLPVTNKYTLKGVTIKNGTTEEEVGKWINEAKNNNAWVIFTINQINESGQEQAIAQARFEKIISLILDSKLTLVTPSQIINPGDQGTN